MNQRNRTLLGAAAFGALGLVAFVKAGAYTTGGANVFPQTIAVVMTASAVALVVQTLLRTEARSSGASLETVLDRVEPRMLLIMALSCLFVLAMPWLGMTTSSFIFIVTASWMLGLRRPLLVIGAAAAFSIFVPWVFVRFLHVLPPPDLIMSLVLPGRG